MSWGLIRYWEAEVRRKEEALSARMDPSADVALARAKVIHLRVIPSATCTQIQPDQSAPSYLHLTTDSCTSARKSDQTSRNSSMVRSTQIARVSDGLPLAQSVDDDQTEKDLSEYKQQAKLIFRRLGPSAEQGCSIESGNYTLQ